ncbi:hypothetical protein CH333_03390 [candidate division WOR-3 bacterium JGI_Cruoil_03_44_89]|uniref:Antitoxin n=1 Tax=candidate division WOR-3 bacterium JGI_Cruoil_03_44_89 TaxID=1973748 RepID=A0A235BVL4_UNCW3|nr:MAG: hypothetical protein CH333_03390 [candidate division WOR-3 bacterium JGI_Cruoil_03_44_89]
MGPTITIPRRLTHGEELVVVRRQEYEQLQKHLAEVRDALTKIRQGEKELHTGKTRTVESLAELRH